MEYEIFKKMQLCRLKISDIKQKIALLLQHLNPFFNVPTDHQSLAIELLFLKYIFFLLN
jgi:hypothetical protein